MKIFIWLAVLLGLGTASLHGQSGLSAQKKAHANEVRLVRSLVTEAHSERNVLAQMIETEPQQLPKSRIGLMLHAVRDAQLNKPDWSSEIIASLPSSDLEMEAFLEFTVGHGNEQFQPFFRTYYTMAFRAAESHPEALHKIFEISHEYGTKNWPDYDNIDWFCDELKEVRKRSPESFKTALQSENPSLRSYVAGCSKPLP